MTASTPHQPPEDRVPESRKERDRRLREEDLLVAAERLISRQGYYQTSMEDIAREAEYATGTIYRYFSSKEDLYRRLLLDKGRSYFEELRGVLSDADSPAVRLRELLRAKVRFFYGNREYFRIYVGEVAGSGASCRLPPPEELRGLHQEYLELLRGVLREGMEMGEFRRLNVEMVLAGVIGMSTELLHRSLDEGFEVSEEEIALFLDAFLEGGLIQSRGSNG